MRSAIKSFGWLLGPGWPCGGRWGGIKWGNMCWCGSGCCCCCCCGRMRRCDGAVGWENPPFIRVPPTPDPPRPMRWWWFERRGSMLGCPMLPNVCCPTEFCTGIGPRTCELLKARLLATLKLLKDGCCIWWSGPFPWRLLWGFTEGNAEMPWKVAGSWGGRPPRFVKPGGSRCCCWPLDSVVCWVRLGEGPPRYWGCWRDCNGMPVWRPCWP